MTTSLAKLSEPKLRAWLLARMRGDEVDPPVDESRMESPDDFVQLVHQQTSDEKLRARIEKATVAALNEVAQGDLSGGPDARAARHLAWLADGLALAAAEPVLRGIAFRGALGGHDGALDPELEPVVLFALAGVQKEGELYDAWHGVWKRDLPALWPVVTTGLRLSDPKRALAILHNAVVRAGKHQGFPLGEILWAFATDPHISEDQIVDALQGLNDKQRARAREELAEVGALPEEIDAWVPLPSAAPWWERAGLHLFSPPRLGLAWP